MTKEQINKLLKDGEIWPVSAIKQVPDITEFYYYDQDKKEQFYISQKVYTVLQLIFNFFLETEIYEERDILLAELKIKEKHYQPGVELKKALFNEMILSQIKLFDACFEPGRPYFEKSSIVKKDLFIFDLLADSNNPAKLIELLKFNIFKGKIIDPNLSKTVLFAWILKPLEEFYYSKQIENSFRVIALDQNIKYLQNSLAKLDSHPSEEFPLTKQGIAIACILKGKLLYDRKNIDAVLSEYYPGEKLRRQFGDEVKKHYANIFDTRTNKIVITKNCNNPQVIAHRIRAIRGITSYLTTAELKEADLLLQQLEKQKTLLS